MITLEQYNEFIGLGFSILPTKENKAPAVAKWQIEGNIPYNDFNAAYGIAIRSGRASGGVECLDFDNPFQSAKQTLTIFIEQLKPLYDQYKFPIFATPNGGYHLLYRCEVNEGNRKLAQKPMYDNKLRRFVPKVLIETRGEGGYFCTAPTPNYTLLRNSLSTIPTISVEVRKLLIETALSMNEWAEPTPTHYEEQNRPGDIYNATVEAISEAKDLLRGAGWYELQWGKWRRPGKADGISATFGYTAENLFYCFTANGYPFEPMKGYTPFQILSLLKNNGDFKLTAKELADRYELKKPVKIERVQKEEKKEPLTDDEFIKLYNSAFIDLSIEQSKPPTILQVIDNEASQTIYKRMFTLGNFSAITGKSKSKKTFLSTLILAAIVKNGIIEGKFYATVSNERRGVLHFDTEQSRYDAYIAGRRVLKLINDENYTSEHYGIYGLRDKTPKERCEFIELVLQKCAGSISYILIDGIADLAYQNNDEVEATKLVGMLMRWTQEYNCHITVVIHQNKGDNYATGHLGSSIMKKCECVISAEKNKDVPNISHIRNDMIRGEREFNDFEIEIVNGLPIVHNDVQFRGEL